MKPQVAVVTDSGANLPGDLIQRFDITVVPLWLRINGSLLRDEVEITRDEFYARMRAGEGPLSTSQPSMGDFLKAYQGLARRANGILSIHVSARLSGTLSAAQAAARQMTGFPIQLLDSKSGSMGQGFAVLEAARMIARGMSMDDVMNSVDRLLPKIQLLGLLDTLEYIVKGGRLELAANVLHPMLKTRALISLRQSQLRLLRLARTRAKGFSALLTTMAARVENAPIHVAILHADASDVASQLQEEITARFKVVEVLTTALTPVLGTHGGVGMVGVAFYPDGG
jgi:DegV family protein with EDD domain